MYRDNGKENGNDYIIIGYILGLYWGYIGDILGMYRENEKENGNSRSRPSFLTFRAFCNPKGPCTQ